MIYGTWGGKKPSSSVVSPRNKFPAYYHTRKRRKPFFPRNASWIFKKECQHRIAFRNTKEVVLPNVSSGRRTRPKLAVETAVLEIAAKNRCHTRQQKHGKCFGQRHFLPVSPMRQVSFFWLELTGQDGSVKIKAPTCCNTRRNSPNITQT